MNYLLEISKYLWPLLGVFLGWLLTQKSETKKNQHNEIRQIKRSLYVLLEIRNQLAVTKRIDRYITSLTEQLNSKIEGESIEKIDKKILIDLVQQIMPSLMGVSYHKDLKEQFRNCIDSLSEIDPLLAYRLNGKQNIQDYIESWQDRSTAILGFDSHEDAIKEIERFKPKLIHEIMTDVESTIEEVARLISKNELARVREAMSEIEDQHVQSQVSEYINRMLPLAQ
jgi:hypothetical protein